MNPRVRQACPADAARVAALDAAANPHPCPRSRVQQVCGRPDGTAVVLLAGQAPAIDAFLVFSRVLDEATVENIVVVEHCRRRGLGRALMLASFERMRRQDVLRCLLEVRVSNRPARALYQSLGFGTDGVRPNYYPIGRDGLREDAVLMSRLLGDP